MQAVQEAFNAYEENPRAVEPTPALEPEEPTPITPEKKGAEPSVPQLGSIDDYRNELAEYVVWFCSDGVLHSDDEIFEAIFNKLPFSRRGSRIISRIDDEIKQLRILKRIN